MIEGNILKFGFGSIAVGHDMDNYSLRISHTLDNGPVGNTLDERIGDIVYIGFPFGDDFVLLENQLRTVSEENPLFHFRGYVFDFSHYNPVSVQMVIKRIDIIKSIRYIGLFEKLSEDERDYNLLILHLQKLIDLELLNDGVLESVQNYIREHYHIDL